MTAGPRPRRRRLRARVALVTGTAFVALGALMVLGYYALVGRVLSAQVATVHLTWEGDPGGDVRCELADPGDAQCALFSGGSVEPLPPDSAVAVAGEMLLSSQQGLVELVLDDLRAWTVVLLVVLATAAAGVAWWVAGRALRPVADLTATVRRIGHEDLDERLRPTGPPDEVRELGEAFDAMLDRVQAAFDAQRRFLGNAAHELRTPLAAASTALDVPLAQDRVPDHLRPALTRAVDAHRRAGEVLDALLGLARTLGARDEVERRRDHVDLAAVAARQVDALRGAARRAGVAVDAALDPAVLLADPTLLALICRNLLDNAVRYNHPGGRVRVSTTADLARGAVRLEVANDGAVLEPVEVPRLVEPLHRGGASRLARGAAASHGAAGPHGAAAPHGADGLGLGLSLVTEVVGHLRGHLALHPRDQGGLRVVVQLPVAAG